METTLDLPATVPMTPPILTPDRIAEIVVDRLLGVGSPEAVAVGRLLVSLDPESVRLAEAYEARVRYLMAHTEDPVTRFERLTGIRLDADPGRGDHK